MMEQQVSLDQVFDLAKLLPITDKIRLIERIAPQIERDLVAATPVRSARKSLWGLWADLGPGLSAEDIDEARREAWANFPREDI